MACVFSMFLDLLNNPIQGGAERLVRHRAAGFADGLQPTERPILRTVLSQLSHEQAVRQHNQVHVPCLALAVAKLTISHAKLLLTVPMIGLRSCPAMSIGLQYATHFPCCPVGDQDLARFGVTAVIPKDDDTYFVVYFGNVQCTGEAPLPLVAATQFLAVFRRDRSRHCIGPQFLSLPLQLAIELQVADVPPRPFILVLLGVNVIQILGIGETFFPRI